MWFWSVSWSTNCPVFFSFFLVDQKKIVQSLGIFDWPKKIWSTKNFQRLTKNSLRLDNFFLVDQKNWKKTRQLVDQETDQNHMDGTNVVKLPKSAGARHYCPKILRVPGTLGTCANSSPGIGNFQFWLFLILFLILTVSCLVCLVTLSRWSGCSFQHKC